MNDPHRGAATAGAPRPAPPPASPPDDHGPKKRRRLRRLFLWVLALAVLVAAAGWAVWHFSYARWWERTDDAYVGGNVVQITPRTAGTVVRIAADDNDLVSAGQALVQLDATDTEVALERARAALGQAARRVSGLFSAVQSARAEVAVREAALAQARSDFERRQRLAGSGAVSAEEFAHARDALATAQSARAAARAELAAAQAQVAGTDVASHPDVLAAAAELRSAWLEHRRTTVPAPVTGHVAQRTVQLGQHVQPGTPLMAVVPLQAAWVDANFKETQLEHMRIGQPATLSADLYGRSVTYHGRVAGLGIGTGSAFSLLPAQNATGNWIKIVQRLPVRITLDPAELAEHPLRIGLSMNVRIDLHDDSGPALAGVPAAGPGLTTDTYASDAGPVDALIAQIIADNGGADAAATGAH